MRSEVCVYIQICLTEANVSDLLIKEEMLVNQNQS